MFIEVCLICASLKAGSDLIKKVRDKGKKDKRTDPSDHLSLIKKSQHHPVRNARSQESQNETLAKETRQMLPIAAASTALAAAGFLFAPSLSFLSGVGTLCACVPLFKVARNALFKERTIRRIEVLDSVAIIAALSLGYYFASALAVLVYYGAQKLRLTTELRSRESLASIFSEQPRSVWLLRNHVEVEVPFEDMQAGDVVVVSAGEPIPADGEVIRGVASVDQHMLTGEAQPAEKSVGDKVFAATVMISGKLHIRVEKTGKESVAAQIAEILKTTADFTAAVESTGQEIANDSVVPTIGISAVAYPIVGIGGSVALLCSDFLDNMRVMAPLSMLNFLEIASREGILIKDGRSLQLLPQVDTIVFDKTGTLTLDQPYVRHIHTFGGTDADMALTWAAAAEQRQPHPIARAILEEAEKRRLKIPGFDDAAYKVGYGITVRIRDRQIRVGSDRFMADEGLCIPDAFDPIRQDGFEQGFSYVYVAADDRVTAAIELEPMVRPEAEHVIRKLRKRGMRFYIISGDHEKPTQTLSDKLGIQHFFANVLPRDKAELIEKLQKRGRKVCFIGDGINDAIALKTANVSISVSGATTVATDSAQIVMMDQTLAKIPELFDIGNNFQNNMKNTFMTICGPAVLGIGGVFFIHLGVPAMTLLYSLSLGTSASVVMFPAIRHKQSGKLKASEDKTAQGQRRSENELLREGEAETRS